MARKRIIKIPKRKWVIGQIAFGITAVIIGFLFLIFQVILTYIYIGPPENFLQLLVVIILSIVWFGISVLFFIKAKNIVDLEIFENGFIDPFPPFPFTKPSRFISFNEVKKISQSELYGCIIIKTKDDSKHYFLIKGDGLTLERMNEIYEKYKNDS